VQPFARVGPCALFVYLVSGTVLVGCGGNVPEPEARPVERAAPAPAPGPTEPAPTAVPAGALPAAATTCSPLLGHAAYTAQSCESCHPCGAKATSGGHPATWSDRTSPGFHAYSANAGIANCKGCHGAALDGVGGTAKTSCAQCHGATWKTNCVLCHGGTANQTGAPPRTTWGNTADATRVGAHTAHLAATHALAAAVTCATCHVVPTDALAAGHVDGGTAEVTFSGRAIQGTTTAAWARASATCSNTYCHGATLKGGTVTAPVWTQTSGAARACNACHGAPPPAPHSTSTACAGCHAGYTATTVNLATHMNGVIDATGTTCTSCHGTATRAATTLNPQLAAAPPVDTTGATATTARGVGAHMKHLSTATRSLAFACTECHVVPTSTSHANGVKDVAFGALARTGGKTPTYSATTLGCSATYCHGNFTNGKTTAVPLWTGGTLACNACHNMPNTFTGRHSKHGTSSFNCSECHNGIASGTSAATAAITGPTLHVNGVVNVVFTPTLSFTSTGSGTARRCNGTCHGKSHSSLSW
jgi:predicted CxxxxCH...CXXCH cytochrome family protein